ncbi:MAG: xanthine dehydrogenase FAD-binding subunit XdhB [Treponema sp.]|nr:xanthine dehydrogenase FAD-binding subunit XdhB [Treponema sp.]
MYDYGDYAEATGIPECLALLRENPEARIIAGGTDILVKLREGDRRFVGRALVGIRRIPGIADIGLDSSGGIVLGAGASFAEVAAHPLVRANLPSLARGAESVGGPQLRNAGTVGGNIANGASSADTAPALFTLNARLTVHGGSGVREVPIGEFYLGPGKVALDRGELISSIRIAREDYEGYRGEYLKFAVRAAMDIATIGCAVLIRTDPEGRLIRDLRIAFGVAGPTPLRAETAEDFARGKTISPELLAEIGEKCLMDTKVRDSWRATKAFREQLIRTLPKRAIACALAAGTNTGNEPGREEA